MTNTAARSSNAFGLALCRRLCKTQGNLVVSPASDTADFTGMANPVNPDEGLCVSKVFHRAIVKVDERGTEAAAATAVVMMVRGVAFEVEEFRVDHPFLFFIRDTASGLILFVGRVVDI